MMIHVHGNDLVLSEDARVSFDFPIKQVIEVEGVLVVVLVVPKDRVITENVFCVSPDGKILWQIERIPETATNPVNCYMDVHKGQPGTVVAGNWNATDVTVDLANGKVISTYFTK